MQKKKLAHLIRGNFFFNLLYCFITDLGTCIRNLPWYLKSRKEFRKQVNSIDSKYNFDIVNFHCLADRSDSAGRASDYMYQDLWAAKKIAKLDPNNAHYDIGSRIDGFISTLLSFRGNIVLIDIRPLPYFVDNGLDFIQSDATGLNNIDDASVSSLSALCSLEHFGLGRYSDPIDPMACYKAFDSIQRVVKTGGRIYLSVPIGRQRIEFNAQRIFYPQTIIDCFDKSKLLEFSVITLDPQKPIDINADINSYNDSDSLYALFGLFEFERL